MSKQLKPRKNLSEIGTGFYRVTKKSDKVIYAFRTKVKSLNNAIQENFSEKNVLYFVARSYKDSCLKLLQQMKSYDNNITLSENLALLYLPAMFCFRHYLELQLKLLYMDWHKEEYCDSHDLNLLLENLEKNNTCNMSVFKEPIEYITKLEQINGKSAVEFFRYLINREFECKESIEIPMFEFDKIFHFIGNIETQTTIARINNLSANK